MKNEEMRTRIADLKKCHPEMAETCSAMEAIIDGDSNGVNRLRQAIPGAGQHLSNSLNAFASSMSALAPTRTLPKQIR